MPRLFTGLEIPDDVAFDLDLMRGGILGARWIDRESHHITLRFIGDIDDSLAREIAYELEGVEARPFALRLTGCGAFGGNKPHALYVRVEENAELRRLQSIHERICQVLGLPPEPRKFTPHVTLARLVRRQHRWLADGVRSWRVRLVDGKLRWDDGATVHRGRAEPGASLLRRVLAAVLRRLPIETQL